MGKFVIYRKPTGFVFHLRASNAQTICTSEVYGSEADCRGGIESVRQNAPIAKIEDQTMAGCVSLSHPKFELYKDKGGEHFRFRLIARNGRNIAASEGYNSKDACKKGIESVKENAPTASVEIAEEI